MKNNNAHSVQVSENIYLKQDIKSKKYHYYFRINGKQHRKSTKTADIRKAESIARSEYIDIEKRITLGLCDTVISFNTLKAKYLKSIEDQSKHKFHKETLERHHTPFFGKFTDITKIKPLIDDTP